MKKIFIVLLVITLVIMSATSAMAVPNDNFPAEKAGRANANAADGLHRAAGNVANANGNAAHVLLYWVGPGPGHGVK